MATAPVVVGATADAGGVDAVALGAAWARSLGTGLELVHVRVPAWPVPGPGQVDAEWDAFLQERARDTLEHVQRYGGHLVEGLATSTAVVEHRSSGSGLATHALHTSAPYVVIGSTPGADLGRIGLGSTSDQLLHGCEVPVLLAPAGYATVTPGRVSRLVVAHQGTPESRRALQVVLDVAAEHELHVHVLTLVVRVTRIYGTALGGDAEAGVLAKLRAMAEQQHHAVLATATVPVTTQVVQADSVGAALWQVAWEPGDLLVAGSSGEGPLRRVFLGDTTHRLLRASPVPVLVAPRGDD